MKSIFKTFPLSDPLFWAKRRFKEQRAHFYLDLAESMEAEPGTRITHFLTRYAERYPAEPVGKLAQHWLNTFREAGSFAQAMRGTVPHEDIGVLSVAEQAGDLKAGLTTLSTTISGLDATKEAMWSVFVSSILVFLALQFYIGFYSFKIIPQLEQSLPATMKWEDIGATAMALHKMSHLVRRFWPVWAALIAGAFALSAWAVPHYTGRFRPWLDRHIIHFQLYRAFQAATFLTSLAAMTQRMNNQVLPVPQALKMMEAEASPWLRWHIGQILANMENHVESKGENFNTGLVSKAIHYRMIDIAEYADMSDMLDRVGKQMLKHTPKEMEARAIRLQFIARVLMVAIVFALSAAFYRLSSDFQDAVTINAYLQ